MTQGEFIKEYCDESNLLEADLFDKFRMFAVPCFCADGGGEQHWGMIRRQDVEHHFEFCYAELEVQKLT